MHNRLLRDLNILHTDKACSTDESFHLGTLKINVPSLLAVVITVRTFS